MLICRNTEGVHGQRKFGNPSPKGVVKGSKGAIPPKFLENIVILALRGVFSSKIVLFA